MRPVEFFRSMYYNSFVILSYITPYFTKKERRVLMKLSTTTINNVDECYIVSATSTYGIGFITYIAYSLCSFFGLPSSKMAEKIDMAKAEATHEITKQATDMKADGIMGIRYQMSFLSVMAYGTAYKNKKEPVTESASKNNTKTVKPEAAESYENPNSSSATENAKKQFVDDNTIICSFCNYKQAANRNVDLPPHHHGPPSVLCLTTRCLSSSCT